MINIDIAIVGNESVAPSLPFVVENNVNTVTATYTFDTAWDGYTKTALFWTDTVTAIPVLLVDGVCAFPHEVMATGEPVNFGVYGLTTGKRGETLRINSSPLILRLEEGTYRASTAPIDPTPDVYEQIINLIGGLDNLITIDKSSVVAAVNEAISRNIESFVKTSTVGLVDTYTITYYDGTTSTIDVTNGDTGTAVTIDAVLSGNVGKRDTERGCGYCDCCPLVSSIGDKQAALTFDDVPTEGSENPVKSGGLYTAFSGK